MKSEKRRLEASRGLEKNEKLEINASIAALPTAKRRYNSASH